MSLFCQKAEQPAGLLEDIQSPLLLSISIEAKVSAANHRIHSRTAIRNLPLLIQNIQGKYQIVCVDFSGSTESYDTVLFHYSFTLLPATELIILPFFFLVNV